MIAAKIFHTIGLIELLEQLDTSYENIEISLTELFFTTVKKPLAGPWIIVYFSGTCKNMLLNKSALFVATFVICAALILINLSTKL